MAMNRRKMLAFIGSAPAVAAIGAEAMPARKKHALKFSYRTAGPWGQGNGSPLTAEQIDHNWWILEQALRE